MSCKTTLQVWDGEEMGSIFEKTNTSGQNEGGAPAHVQKLYSWLSSTRWQVPNTAPCKYNIKNNSHVDHHHDH